MAERTPAQRRPGAKGGAQRSDWDNKRRLKSLSAAEQVAQQYSRQGGSGGGGGGGGKKSGGGICGLITLALLSIPVSIIGGIAYGATHFFD